MISCRDGACADAVLTHVSSAAASSVHLGMAMSPLSREALEMRHDDLKTAYFQKITAAPPAISANPRPIFHVIGSFSTKAENSTNTTRVITSCMVLSSAVE